MYSRLLVKSEQPRDPVHNGFIFPGLLTFLEIVPLRGRDIGVHPFPMREDK